MISVRPTLGVPLAEESRYLFGFTYAGKQYTYTRIPQGFKHLAHLFNQVLKADLEDLTIDSTLIQYVDDLIICSKSLEQCHNNSIKVLKKLAQGGHKVSKTTIQYCQPQVEYLGQLIAFGTQAIAPAQVQGVSKTPLPQTRDKLSIFLE